MNLVALLRSKEMISGNTGKRPGSAAASGYSPLAESNVNASLLDARKGEVGQQHRTSGNLKF